MMDTKRDVGKLDGRQCIDLIQQEQSPLSILGLSDSGVDAAGDLIDVIPGQLRGGHRHPR